METTEIKPKEKKVKRLFVAVTPSKHESIMKYCQNKKVTLTDLVLFALKQTFEL
jgi:hypothetical protein